MRIQLQIFKKLVKTLLFLFALHVSLLGFSQQEIDNPNLDQIPKSLLEQSQTQQRMASQVITIDHYDNYFLGVDFAEGHIAGNTEEPKQFFTAFNTSASHHTEDGTIWTSNSPSWGGTVYGDPVIAYDGSGHVYYENMYGSGGIDGCKVARSSDNGATWDFVKVAISGYDKNWIAADQTDGPYADYVYTTMTGGSGGNFARSTDHGETWQTTWSTSTQSLPGMMVCVGPEGSIDGGAVYVVTNSGSSFASTYTFYKSTDGGATFTYMSAQNFSGYVGTDVNGRNSVENMRTRPYPFIAADNSDGDYRGRLHLVYASNDPPGNGGKPDIFSRYSDDGGATWSAAKKVNNGLFISNSHQWAPAIWCDKDTGKLYVQWMDSRDSPSNDSASIYATYSDDGGQTFKPNRRISNEMMVINCTTCGGGGTPRYQGDYNGIVSNGDVAMASWADFRYGNFASFTAYFPDFAMYIYPTVKTIAYRDTVWAVVPNVKLYDNEAIFTATLPTPSTGSFEITYPEGQSISSFPDSVPIVITANNVPLGTYSLKVKGEGPNGTPVHLRQSSVTIIALPPPEAEFSASATEVCVDGAIDFTDMTLYNPTSWAWTFEGGTPETSTEQNPTGIVYSAEGTFDVTLSVVNNSGTDEIVKTDYISVSLQPEPPAGDDISVCLLDEVPPLEVTGTNVLWYKNPELDTIVHEGNIFNTGQTEVGTYTYYATQSTASCASLATGISLTINPLPEATFDALSGVCAADPPVELSGGSPEGGSYFGPGVDAGYFNPATVGEGTYTIGYAYADENSCSDTAYQEIVVNAAPDVTLAPLGSGCINIEPFELTGGNPEGGMYSGDGVEEGMFYPEVAGEGEHLITYFWTDTNGCSNSASQIYTVYALPDVNIGNDTVVCADRMVILNAETPGATSYLWTPGGYTTAIITVDTTGIGIGSQEYMVEVTDNNGCANTASVTVEFNDCTGINEIVGLEGFTIFPNPNDGDFTLNLVSSKPLDIDVKIFNSSGKLFYSKEKVEVNRNFSQKIVIENANAGIYLLLLESDGGKVYKKILIK